MQRPIAVLALTLGCAARLAAQTDSTRPAPVAPAAAAVPASVPAAAPISAPQAAPPSTLYLPIASWVSPYVEYLIRAGVLRGLDPLERPLKRADVARAVARVDTARLAAPVRATLRLVASELEERRDTVRWKVEGYVAAEGASDASRWTDRPQPEDTHAFYQGGLTGSVEFPHVGIVTSPYFDTRMKDDSEFEGYKTRVIAGWNAEAYVRAEWKYFSIFFGSEPRNWGPTEANGLVLSPNPYPYDHLMLRLGPERFRVEEIATELNPLPIQGTGVLTRRYASMHRLYVQPSDRLALALSEGVLYAGDSTHAEPSWEPWYLNPANLWLLVDANGLGEPTKDFLSLEASYLAGRSVHLSGQLFANDVKVDKRTATNPEKPEELGYTLSATGGALGGLATWTALYTRVDNNVYQTQKGTQFQYSLWGVGIGRDHIDYDQSTLKVNTLLAPRAILGGELTFIRQGQGNFALPFPPLDSLNGSYRFLTGVVERTLRVAVQANWTPVPGIVLSTDVGRHFIWNANHVAGVRGDRWVWRLQAEIRRRYSGGVHLGG